MHGVNDPALRLPDDPEIVSAAASLQSQLLYYRLANYECIAIPVVSEAIKTLPPRTRELCLSLSAPCGDDEESHRFLLDYLRDQHLHNEDSLSAAECAVLAALFQSVHMGDRRGQILIKDIAARANQCLQNEGEHFRLSVRHVGIIASSLSFSRRHRTMNGWKLLLEKNDFSRLHEVAARYGADHKPEDLPGFVRCAVCPDTPPTARPFSVGVLVG